MNTMDAVPPFTEQEKRFILAEAIKTSPIPVERLLPVLNEANIIQPDWHQMLLPHGRNLASCIKAFDALRPAPPAPLPPFQSYPGPLAAPKPSTKRKPVPDSLESPIGASKRRQSDMAQHILPKPSNGSPGFSAAQNPVAPKKRGRPSKAIVEQRQAEAIARGEVIAPPKTATPKPEIHPTAESVSTPMYAAIAPMVSPRPAASPLTPVTFAPPEGDSPGKKRRPKSVSKVPKVSKPGESSFPVVNPPVPEPPKPENAPAASSSTESAATGPPELTAPAPLAQPAPSPAPPPPATQAPSTI